MTAIPTKKGKEEREGGDSTCKNGNLVIMKTNL
jgi:hypothetical protein